MNENRAPAAQGLLETGMLVLFRVVDTHTELSPDKENVFVRGRSMKTNITIRPDGNITLTTWGRGESALRWLDQLQGKKRIAPVPAPE